MNHCRRVQRRNNHDRWRIVDTTATTVEPVAGSAKDSPLATPLVAVIAVGAVAAAKGLADIVHSRSIASRARAVHEATLSDLEAAQKPTHERVAEYGGQQIEAVAGTLGRFADWIEHNQMAVNRLGHDPVDGVEISVPELPAIKNEVKAVGRWIEGGIAGASAAVAAPQAALVGVSTFASASTGTAIANLGGAAATNATLAWLGGGSLATGGGGVAAGQAVLGLVAAAPAAFIGGITVAVVGSKQKTSAKRYAAEVNTACEHIRTAIDVMPRITERVTELSDVLTALTDRANEAIASLETLNFDSDLHAPKFLKALQLVRGIREVVNTPVLDDMTGGLTDVSLQVVRKYR